MAQPKDTARYHSLGTAHAASVSTNGTTPAGTGVATLSTDDAATASHSGNPYEKHASLKAADYAEQVANAKSVRDLKQTRLSNKQNYQANQVNQAVAKGFAVFKHLKPGVRAAVVAVLVFLIALLVWNAISPNAGLTITQEASAEPAEEVSEAQTGPFIAVHVDGAVKNPGLYSLEAKTEGDLRINDVVEAAGGLTSEADVTGINLAAKVEDGQKIHIPKRGETLSSSDGSVSSTNSASSTGSGGQSSLVNINTANEQELETLPGVGVATAKAIVEDRKEHGPFSSIEDLMRVSGIGQKKFDKLKGQICV